MKSWKVSLVSSVTEAATVAASAMEMNCERILRDSERTARRGRESDRQELGAGSLKKERREEGDGTGLGKREVVGL